MLDKQMSTVRVCTYIVVALLTIIQPPILVTIILTLLFLISRLAIVYLYIRDTKLDADVLSVSEHVLSSKVMQRDGKEVKIHTLRPHPDNRSFAIYDHAFVTEKDLKKWPWVTEHEIGHVVHSHTLKIVIAHEVSYLINIIACAVLLSSLSVWVSIVSLLAFSNVTLYLVAFHSRHNEYAADAYAKLKTGITVISTGTPDTTSLNVMLFGSHPNDTQRTNHINSIK